MPRLTRSWLRRFCCNFHCVQPDTRCRRGGRVMWNCSLRRTQMTLILAALARASFAADDAPTQKVDPVIVTGPQAEPVSVPSAVPANVPATTESVTATQIEQTINAVTSGEALQYLPSVH